MPDIICCPRCHKPVSRRLPKCHCGQDLGEAPWAFDLVLLESLRDEDLSWAIWLYCWKLFEPLQNLIGASNDRELVATLPPGLRAGYCLFLFASEADNGGYSQWLTNCSGQLTAETLEGARLIQADQCVELLEKILSINTRLEREHPLYRDRWMLDESLRQRGSIAEWKEFHRQTQSDFEAVDALYGEYSAAYSGWSMWEPHLADFARAQPQQFVHDGSLKL
ncbi:DUF4375 domain-containing protein [Planctomyces sp. SH-PL14]|uniref:DMP19 family protein n=1 Tax=Planctomyces sp. SH-PL14 TaxID=1632864 RepID=UPI00078E2B99|nr:DUF4375 domain-containing protein [Planctomyces sp. SH-PL14]AMV21176.1 hypothetical protein VT03_24960 [Planctomyces sp. SH-PL14]